MTDFITQRKLALGFLPDASVENMRAVASQQRKHADEIDQLARDIIHEQRSIQMQLTVTQRELIREIAMDPGGALKGAQRASLNRLERSGLIQPCGGDLGGWQLTTAGWEAHRKIMASGDGPEALKQLLRL